MLTYWLVASCYVPSPPRDNGGTFQSPLGSCERSSETNALPLPRRHKAIPVRAMRWTLECLEKVWGFESLISTASNNIERLQNILETRWKMLAMHLKWPSNIIKLYALCPLSTYNLFEVCSCAKACHRHGERHAKLRCDFGHWLLREINLKNGSHTKLNFEKCLIQTNSKEWFLKKTKKKGLFVIFVDVKKIRETHQPTCCGSWSCLGIACPTLQQKWCQYNLSLILSDHNEPFLARVGLQVNSINSQELLAALQHSAWCIPSHPILTVDWNVSHDAFTVC